MALRLSDPRSSRAGLFICNRLRSHIRMIPDLDIYRAANLLVTYNDFPMLLSFSTNHFGRMPSSYCLP